MGGIDSVRHCVARVVVAAMTMLCCGVVGAQELEYKMELGAMGGIGFYMGDANLNGFYKNVTPAAALMGRYNINPRMALKFDLGYSKVKGNAENQTNKFPVKEGQKLEFNNSLIDLGCQYEINFFGYGTGSGYKGHKRLAPYIQMGLGFTYAGSSLTMNIPVGFGIKYKLMERVNVGADWTMRFAMGDKLDGIENPYKIESGFLKNKDSYSFTMVYLSYDLFPKYRKCNND